jgi:hypothetical protein
MTRATTINSSLALVAVLATSACTSDGGEAGPGGSSGAGAAGGGGATGGSGDGGSGCVANAPSIAEIVGGRCLQTLALPSGQERFWALAVDAAAVYWTWVDFGALDGGVLSVPLEGGPTAALTSGWMALGIAIDEANVYWTDSANPDGKVVRIAKGGGAPTTLATGQPWAHGVAVDATHVYWTNAVSMAGGSVHATPLGGGAVTALAANEDQPHSMVVASGSVFWATLVGVNRVPITGGSATVVAEGAFPGGLTADGTHVYWANSGYPGGKIMKAPLAGGAAVELVPTSHDSVVGVAVDETSVYWTTIESGTVMKVGLDGGATTELVSGQVEPRAIVADATSLYWVNSGGAVGASLMRLTPK